MAEVSNKVCATRGRIHMQTLKVQELHAVWVYCKMCFQVKPHDLNGAGGEREGEEEGEEAGG